MDVISFRFDGRIQFFVLGSVFFFLEVGMCELFGSWELVRRVFVRDGFFLEVSCLGISLCRLGLRGER